MHGYDEPVEVRRGWVAGMEAPAQFLWRNRLWLVREAQTRAAGIDGTEAPQVWRVVAGDGREGTHGVYELAHAAATDQWRLRTVLD